MPYDERFRDRGVKDNVQNVGVPRVPGQTDLTLQDESSARVLDPGRVRFHYLHIRDKIGYDAKCGVCGGGLEGVLEAVEIQGAGAAPLVKGGGADEEGPAAPPPDDGADQREDSVLWR